MNIAPSATDDEQHLRLLSIFHYVAGGLTGLFACFPLIRVALGLGMIFAPQSLSNRPGDQPPAFVGWFFTCVGGGFFLAGLSVAVGIVIAGRFHRAAETLLVHLRGGVPPVRFLSVRHCARRFHCDRAVAAGSEDFVPGHAAPA